MGGMFGGTAPARNIQALQASGSAPSPAYTPAEPQIIYMPSIPTMEYISAPTDNTAEVKAAAEKQRKAMSLAKGRSSTLLTGGAGLDETAPVGRKTLLGE